ncbi:DDB1- and CUL4-associated factor 10 isoform X1 [Bicyclus anynana]|uniref:DDB1- and CUL4-associated factor 10 isoform X1 n=1 Tax=Bicyclus anynana TaxID=110368 RepID=A0A6J1MSQ4_BICAN|nr:DDB1- and CUL4-associated factor 10 isoform X1 [Bicyclus anynana]
MGTIGLDSSFMAKYSAYSPYRLIQRETGFENPVGAGNAMARSLYRAMKPLASWDCEIGNTAPIGGVFNLEFSPEGSLLVAACEKKSIQIFDPLTHKRIHSVNDAHLDCVNCVKFLDGRMFATCSDDTTIALWDVRNLKKKIRSLLGHSNWVKNIEFSVKDKLLVTSGLDGSIYTWDINSYTEFNLVYQRVFHASGLMRCRLSPDAKQMVMCTTGGLLVIIHNLNLSTLSKDLHGFKPNLYRLMQRSQQVIPIAAMYDHLFDAKRTENRVEFVSDFPEGNDAEVVSALQIHPQGWCALSRNISHDDRSEWSCIHDIQPSDSVSDKSCRDSSSPPPPPRVPAPRRTGRRTRSHPYHQPRPMAAVTPAGEGGATNSNSEGSSRPRAEPEPEPEAGPSASRSDASPARPVPVLSSIQNDVWEASITIKQQRMLQEMYSRGQVGRNFNMQRIMGINTGISPPGALRSRHLHASARPAPRLRASAAPASSAPDAAIYATLDESEPIHIHTSSPSTSGQTPRRDSTSEDETPETRHYIRQNRERLLYYKEETNLGKGFIKELCFSADGRLVCSPFGRGMRLLALNDYCAELSHCVQDINGPTEMVDLVRSLFIHQDLVVSSKFSPRHHLLVTGCLEGKVVWYDPYSGPSVY